MNDQIIERTLLLAEHTLGLLSPSETVQAQRLLGSDPGAVVDALKWEQALLELTDRLAPAPLSDNLWEEIAEALDMDAAAIAAYPLPLRPEHVAVDSVAMPHQPPPVASIAPAPDVVFAASAMPAQTPPPMATTPSASTAPPIAPATPPDAAPAAPAAPIWPQTSNNQPPLQQQINAQKRAGQTASASRHIRPMHIGMAAGLLGVAVLASRLIPVTPAAPAITVLEVAPTLAAILQAPGNSSTPAWVVTITPQGDVLLHPHVHTEIPDQASVQLWTYSLSLPEPRSLGLIDPNLPVTVPASLMGEISADQMFEMTQEPEGGSASAGPSGPVLFIGRVVTFGLPVPAPVSDISTGSSTSS